MIAGRNKANSLENTLRNLISVRSNDTFRQGLRKEISVFNSFKNSTYIIILK